jgi:hypothetical protein
MLPLKRLSLILSVALIWGGCASDYRTLQTGQKRDACALLQPEVPYKTGWFSASIDVVGKHLSGLIFIKEMEDRSVRVVFTNEVGVTFFDFSYTRSGEFSVKQIMPMLNKKAVIKTLQKDFALFIGLPFRNEQHFQVFTVENEIYHRITWDSGTAYFITDPGCSTLQRMEYGSKKKKLVSITYPTIAESLIRHHTFQMQIHLKAIEK